MRSNRGAHCVLSPTSALHSHLECGEARSVPSAFCAPKDMEVLRIGKIELPRGHNEGGERCVIETPDTLRIRAVLQHIILNSLE